MSRKDKALARALFYDMHINGLTSNCAAKNQEIEEFQAVEIMNSYPQIRKDVIKAFKKEEAA